MKGTNNFHTISPSSSPATPRTPLHGNLFPSFRGQSQLSQFIDDSLVFWRTDQPIACNTAETTGFSGATQISLVKSGVEFFGGLTEVEFIDGGKSRYVNPIIVAQIVVDRGGTPPAPSVEELLYLPFIDANTDGDIEESASFKLVGEIRHCKGRDRRLLPTSRLV